LKASFTYTSEDVSNKPIASEPLGTYDRLRLSSTDSYLTSRHPQTPLVAVAQIWTSGTLAANKTGKKSSCKFFTAGFP